MYLASCQLPSGAINDPIPDPLATLALRHPSRRLAFRMMGGADIWHTTNALLAFAATKIANPAAQAFVRSKLTRNGELSYWSYHPSLCIETCAAAFRALPDLRRKLVRTIERHALPGGRWPTSMVPGQAGHDFYLTGPSVTAWALGALDKSQASAQAGRRYLQETLDVRGMWSAHPAFYATPFYPAHLAVPYLANRLPVVQATLRAQISCGGWAFNGDQASSPSALPTALAVSTLLASGVASAVVAAAVKRGLRFLLDRQKRGGAFSLAPAPASLFYAGDVYATSVALRAMVCAEEALS
jgi:hypothetical protein